MKNNIKIIAVIVLFFCSIVSAQQLSFDEIRNNYKSFNYSKVIELSQPLLSGNTLAKEEIIELQTMNAVSYYSLNDESSARKSFIEILKLDSNYSLDPAFISPKIITLFENTKKDFNQIYIEKQENINDDKRNEDNTGKPIQNHSANNSYLLQSIILPGWGQIGRASCRERV